jgi:soluble lytic murein transglycosylase-like protein
MDGTAKHGIRNSYRHAFFLLRHGLVLAITFAVLAASAQRISAALATPEAPVATEPVKTVEIAPPAPVAAASKAPSAAHRRHHQLSGYLARRFRLAQGPGERMVSAAYQVADQVGLDPLLLLAVMAIESRFNPIAESDMGAKGLMQVIPKYHAHMVAQHGGEQAMLDPSVNILLGARILKDYIKRTGSVEAGLQYYNGALADETTQYAEKVIAEQERLKQALRDPPSTHSAARI